MVVKITSGSIQGIEVETVEIETDIQPRQESPDPSANATRFSIIGLPDAAVRESRDRVRSAMTCNDLRWPYANITINLAPAALRKSGALYDLPIALGVMAGCGMLEPSSLADTMIVGELGLNGEIRSIRGALPLATHAASLGLRKLLLPAENAEEAAAANGIEVYGVRHLMEAVEFLQGRIGLLPTQTDAAALLETSLQGLPDFLDVKGQESAKRALQIAAAGNHNLLMIGPPGCGKSLIANRLPGIMPPLSLEEALEVSKIYSAAGLLPPSPGLITARPFRSPHHTVSDAGLLGGGNGIPRPGEITFAHRGVLFLDELPEFRRNVLEALRQPLENGTVTVARAAGAFVFPCRFMLVAAMNPCPCGFAGSRTHTCKCSPLQVASYRSRISGPLLDRIDMHIELSPLPQDVLAAPRHGEDSATMRARVVAARRRQQARFAGTPVPDNAGIYGVWLDKFCTLDEAGRQFLSNAMMARHMSARSYDRILRVARTCADLAGREQIAVEDIAEACQYRVLDKG